MSQQVIAVGSAANDGTGDPARTAGQKINSNFSELFLRAPGVKGARAIAVGDSMLGFGWHRVDCSTAAGTFVVSGGIATINATSHLLLPGWRVSLCNLGSEAMTGVLNGANLPVLTVPSNNQFTVSATYDGQTMPDGDYSSSLGAAWTVYNMSAGRDSAFHRWLNLLTDNPHQFIANFAFIGATATQIRNIIPKILAGPTFDVFHLCMGTNSLGGGAAITLANAMRNGQIAFRDIVEVASSLNAARGASAVIYIPPPFGSGTSNEAEKNRALVQLRNNLVDWAARTPWVTLIDTFADVIDGRSVDGVAQSTYIEAAGVHTTTVGNLRIAKNRRALFRDATNPVDKRPVSIIDDGTTYAQTLPAWAGSTAYSLTDPNGAWVVVNGGRIYYLRQSGTSAASGGPTGTGTGIVDGSCIWDYVAPYSRNIVINGLMTGTVANSGITLTGTRPTGWTLQNNASVTGSTAGQVARGAVTDTNAAFFGYGFDLNLTFASATSQFALNAGATALLIPGQWYRAGIRVRALADLVNVSEMRIVCDFNNGVITTNASAMTQGNNTTTIPLLNGDEVQIITDPFYVPPGWTPTQAILFFYISTNAAGSASIQLSEAFWKAIADPYA